MIMQILLSYKDYTFFFIEGSIGEKKRQDKIPQSKRDNNYADIFCSGKVKFLASINFTICHGLTRYNWFWWLNLITECVC